jgi:hypothetical protein
MPERRCCQLLLDGPNLIDRACGNDTAYHPDFPLSIRELTVQVGLAQSVDADRRGYRGVE